MVHRTVFAVPVLAPETKQPVTGRQLDLSVEQKLETTLLEHVVCTYSVRLGVHPVRKTRYLCENSALFFASLSSVRLLRLFCVLHAFVHPPLQPPPPPLPTSPPPSNPSSLCSICVSVFCKLDWLLLGTMTVRHAQQAASLLPSGQRHAQLQRHPYGVGAAARGSGLEPGGHVYVVQRERAARH